MVRISDVWDRTTEFLGEHLSVLLPIAVLAILLPSAVNNSLAELQAVAGPAARIALALFSVAVSIVSLWAQLAIVALAIDPSLGRRATRTATARLLPAIGVFLLIVLLVIALALPLALIAVASHVDFQAMQAGAADISGLSGGIAAAFLLYALAFLVAVIFLGARLMPLISVVVAERRGAGAIGRALALTRGLTWKLVGVILLYAVVALVTVLAVRTVFGSILRLVAGGQGSVTVAGVLTAIAVAAATTAFTVLAGAFYAKLYVAIMRSRAGPADPVRDLPST